MHRPTAGFITVFEQHCGAVQVHQVNLTRSAGKEGEEAQGQGQVQAEEGEKGEGAQREKREKQ
jgi:hypothetical protein